MVHPYLLSILKENKKGLLPSCIKLFAYLCSWPYRAAVALRNKFFDWGILKEKAFPDAFVVSIGNIVAGGTGKTPFTHLLTSELIKKEKVAILSRGYHSKAENYGPLLLSKGNGPLHHVSECGDESFLLASLIPESIMIVGKNRRASATLALQQGAKILICDDAFQHRYIKRNLNIVVIHASDPFGRNKFLPRGFLRESPKSLRRADFIVIHGVESQLQYESVKKQISQFTSAPCIGTTTKVHSCQLMDGTPIDIENKNVALFCAIGNPERFIKTTQTLNAQIVDTYFIPDHHYFSHDALMHFARKNPTATLLLCTEKDSVKFDQKLLPPIPIGVLKTRMEVVYDADNWQEVLHYIYHREKVYRVIE